MVTTTSAASTALSLKSFGCSPAMSMPTSAMASTATGLIDPAGADPADSTSTRSPARWRSQPAAIWERPALCTQTNRTVALSVISGLQGRRGGVQQAQQRDGEAAARELHQDEHRDGRRADPGERVGE